MISPSIIGEIGNFTMVHPRTKPTQEAKIQHLCRTFMHWKQPKSQYLAHTINSHPPNLWPHRIPPKCPTQRPYSTHTTQTTMKLLQALPSTSNHVNKVLKQAKQAENGRESLNPFHPGPRTGKLPELATSTAFLAPYGCFGHEQWHSMSRNIHLESPGVSFA